jgi:serine/threonine protein kinase
MEQQLWDEPNSNPSIGRHNIVPLLGYHVDIAPPGNAGEMDPHQFRVSLGVVLQFCEAGSLADRLGLRVRVGEREAMRMVEQLLGALAHLHSLGIVHRTLCASDVLLVPGGRFANGLPLYNVKLANFGGALEVEDHSVDTLDEVRDAWTPHTHAAHICTCIETRGRLQA